jgi:hypothetical protein
LRHILRQAALTLVSFIFLYLTVAAASFVVLPRRSNDGSIDARTAPDTLYMTGPKYVFLGRPVLDNPDRKVILVGASNTMNGFRLNIIQPLVDCAKVSNLGIGGANIHEVKQIINLVHEVQDETTRRLNTFVIGISYGMFVDSKVRYADPDRNGGETDIDIERYRYGFSRRSTNGPMTVLPAKWLDAGVTFLRPLLLFEKLARDARSGIFYLLTGHSNSHDRTEAEREMAVMTEKEKLDALNYWRESMGYKSEISSEQVAILKSIVDDLLLSGEKVVIADLPIPAWHRDASPYQPGYSKALQTLVQRFSGRPGFTFMSMADLDGNLDYSDEVHAKPHLAKVWSTRLADTLNSLVCQGKTEGNPVATETPFLYR